MLIIKIGRILFGLEQAAGSAQHFGDLLDVTGAEAGIDLRHVSQQLIAVALHHAARHHQLLAGAALLVGGGLEDGLDAFLLGAFNEAAGVHHQDLGLFRPGRDGETLELQVPEHHLAIHKVLGASQRHEANCRHSNS